MMSTVIEFNMEHPPCEKMVSAGHKGERGPVMSKQKLFLQTRKLSRQMPEVRRKVLQAVPKAWSHSAD